MCIIMTCEESDEKGNHTQVQLMENLQHKNTHVGSYLSEKSA